MFSEEDESSSFQDCNMKSLALLFLLAFRSVQCLISLEINNKENENEIDLIVNKPLSTDRFTVCVSFKIESSFEHGSIFKDSNVKHELYLHATASYGILNWLGYSFIFKIPPNAISLFKWTNFCSTFNETYYFVVTNGEVWDNLTRVSGHHIENIKKSEIMTLSFGPSLSATAEVTNLNVWSDFHPVGKHFNNKQQYNV